MKPFNQEADEREKIVVTCKGSRREDKQNSLRRSAYKRMVQQCNAREWFTGRPAAGHVRLKGRITDISD
jgi:hypothetical protein